VTKCTNGFITLYIRVSQTGASAPSWGHGAVLWGPRAEAFTTGSFAVIFHNPSVTIY